MGKTLWGLFARNRIITQENELGMPLPMAGVKLAELGPIPGDEKVIRENWDSLEHRAYTGSGLGHSDH